MKTCKKQNECTTYPFCYDCEAWCGTTQELQQEINNFFKGRPYRVQLDIPSFDEFEETLYKFVRTYGGKFNDCNTKEVATRIKEITKKLKNIQARKENETETVTKESLKNVVDLGLPSGTLWAKTNLGAEKETDFGKFFLWGDTQGHSGVEEHQFDWDDYKYGNYNSLTKYNDTDQLTLLEPSDDSAFVATSGQASMPTKDQLQELIDYTDQEWTNVDGVNGMKFMNKSDNTKYIFIPAAGSCSYGSHYGVGSWGHIWSASRNESNANLAWRMTFSAGNVGMYDSSHCYGYSVRAVMVPEDKAEETYDNIDNTDDGQPVDLGLPSGTLWQKSNLGASKPSDFGKFYSWGDIEGYDGEEGYNFSWDTYKWGTSGIITKYDYSNGETNFHDEDDPVYAATGGQYKSPTKGQLQELIDYTNHEWIEIDGVKGMKFTNKNDNTKYIFIPAAGYCNGSNHNDVSSWGYVWSSSRNSGSPNYAWSMYFDAGDVDMLNYSRWYGYNVRGVLNK